MTKLTVEQLAKHLNGVWYGSANHAIFGFSSLSRATVNDVTYFDNLLVQQSLLATDAGVVLIKEEHRHLCPVHCIVVSNPLTAMQKAASLFSLANQAPIGVHETAQVHPTAQLGKNNFIGAYVQVGQDCIIGGASCIAAEVHLADDVVITGMSTVNKTITKPGIYSSGTVVHEHDRWRRNASQFKRLDDYVLKIAALEKKITDSDTI